MYTRKKLAKKGLLEKIEKKKEELVCCPQCKVREKENLKLSHKIAIV